ncbi:hypothetical protein Clacol_000673 [Clathrus columnatus]|uniref:Protein kinase domain-containing protein n=1 Tax=Clathrus columnatus TaxID=1419009 RepID=A0AAV4ZWX0_9AGAM|nr:hypothetical protein Clacol_000673 [Clathrus columnatus]
MTSTPQLLKTPTNERRSQRTHNQKQFFLDHTTATISLMSSSKYTKSPSKNVRHNSPSSFRKRILSQYDGSEKSDSDEDDPDSPSTRRHRCSPFAARCASPFLGAWAGRELKESTSSQPVVDVDEDGLFLSSKAAITPIRGSTFPRAQTSSGARSAIPVFPRLSPLPIVATQYPQTPAETEWHLGRHTESMTKLSLRDDMKRAKVRNKVPWCHLPSSPSPTNRYRGRKRSIEGKELPRAMGGLFESFAETPTAASFCLPNNNMIASQSSLFPTPSRPLLSSVSTCDSPMPPVSLRLQADTINTTEPSQSSSNVEPIARKYKPRDSGIAGIDDSDILEKIVPARLESEDDHVELVTPSLEPSTRSAWPMQLLNDVPDSGQLDDILIKTLATGGIVNKDRRAVPGTPVKRTHYAHSRPWMTVAKATEAPRGAGAPRKSLPLSFPSLSQLQNSPDGSPSERPSMQKKSYGMLGQGRPNLMKHKPNDGKTTLARRSSSGAFSSSSEGSLLGTPTKFNLSDNSQTLHSRSCRASPRPPLQYMTRSPNEFEHPGKFEKEFTTIDALGIGEFGSALKVKYKFGSEQDVFAIKKSKRLEGPKHRRRLREEVDILHHLAVLGGPHGHPNILKYISSWEQDDILFIQTELCELGDLAKFLAEYGSHFAALDEARIWKICAELSNGLNFIHKSGVIHLDLKPANIFITSQGRFRIGDFGMASLWPRKANNGGFEREGDREYMAPEILQGEYSPAADLFRQVCSLLMECDV